MEQLALVIDAGGCCCGGGSIQAVENFKSEMSRVMQGEHESSQQLSLPALIAVTVGGTNFALLVTIADAAAAGEVLEVAGAVY